MKKIGLPLLICSLLFLTACSSQPTFTLSEMETTYENSLQTTLNPLTIHTQKFSAQPLKHITTLTLTTQNTLKGDLSYTSEKYTLPFSPQAATSGTFNGTSEGSEKSTFTFSAHLQDPASPTPILASGTIDTLYTDQTYHFNIQNFNLFMGQGNAEVSFINLFAQQLAHKRVALDQSERFGIAVVETPDVSSLLSQIITLFSTKEIKADFPSTLPATYLSGAITSLDDTYLASAQHFYSLLANLAGLPLITDELALDTSSDNFIGYETRKKNQVSKSTVINYRSSTHTFTTALTFTPEQMYATIFNIQPLDPTQTPTNQTLELYLKPLNATTYTLRATKYQEEIEQRRLDIEGSLSSSDDQLQITFKGDLQIPALKLSEKEYLHLKFQGSETLQPSTETDFSFSGEVIKLSELL